MYTSTHTMRAVALTGFGGPECLEYRENAPEPQAGDGEVRIRVGAAGLNNTDIWTREGAYGSQTDPEARAGWRREALSFPRIQGADVVGHVDQIGAGAPESLLGERVLVDPMLYTGGERELVTTRYLGSERDGGFAEFVTVPAGNAHPINSALSDAELATFPTAYCTALRMLERANVRAGETVIVTGASGGVGSALIQLIALRGAHAVAITSDAKRKRARELGAAAAIDRDEKDLSKAILSTIDTTVDVVADVVGGPIFPELLGILGPLGRYVVAGAIAGPLVTTDLRTVYLKQLQLIGSSFGRHEDFALLLRHIEDGRLVPLLAATYPLRELRRAQADFVAKDFFGKLVVVPEPRRDAPV